MYSRSRGTDRPYSNIRLYSGNSHKLSHQQNPNPDGSWLINMTTFLIGTRFGHHVR